MSTTLWNTWEETRGGGRGCVAVIETASGRILSRDELTEAALAAARSAPDGFRPGQVVAFSERNGAQWLATFLALQRIGAVALPMDSSMPDAQKVAAAERHGAHWYLGGSGDWTGCSRQAVAFGEEADICLLKMTSGTTGEPRPIPFTSANMLADGRQIAATMGIASSDRNFGAIPFGHSYGLGNLVLPLIAQGTAIVCSTEILPEGVATQIEDSGATVFPSVPTVLRALVESSVASTKLGTLKRVISAGAPLKAEVAAAFRERFGVAIHNFYGSSETGGICYDRDGEATAAGRGVGTPLDDVEVALDAENHVTVRSGAVFGSGGHTLADLGAWNERGELVLTGRAVPLANIGGKKVAPAEIERALRALRGVSEAWVGVQSRALGGDDFLLAAVETDRTWSDVRQELATQLPAWQVPRQLWVSQSLPRTERGKLDRRQLEARCAAAGPSGL